MEIENNVQGTVEVKKKNNVLPIVIVGVVAVLVLGVGLYMFLTKKSAQEIYNDIIDDGFEEAYQVLDEYFEEIGNARSLKGNLSLALSSDSLVSENDQKMLDIINDMKLGYDMAVDSKNGKINLDLALDYQNKDLVDVGLAIRENDLFVNLGSLYNKNIRVTSEDITFNWDGDYEDATKDLVREFQSILKKNLKAEYFSEANEVVEVNGKNIKTTKYVLNLDGKELYDLQINIMEDLKNNQKVIDSLIKINGSDRQTVIDDLESAKNEVELNERSEMNIEIYLKRFTNDLIKVVLSGPKDKFTFTNTGKDVYNITYTESEVVNSIGTLEVKDDYLKLNFNYDGMKIDVEVINDSVNFALKYQEGEMNVSMSDESYTLNLMVNSDDANVKINMDGTFGKVQTVSDEYVNNYVDINTMTEDDLNTIYNNLYNNDALMSLVEKIMLIYYDYNNEFSNNESMTDITV